MQKEYRFQLPFENSFVTMNTLNHFKSSIILRTYISYDKIDEIYYSWASIFFKRPMRQQLEENLSYKKALSTRKIGWRKLKKRIRKFPQKWQSVGRIFNQSGWQRARFDTVRKDSSCIYIVSFSISLAIIAQRQIYA